MDARPPLDAALEAFGLPAVVTPPDASPVETTAFWLPPTAVEAPASGATLQRTERLRLLVLPLDAVPEIPRGTIIQVAEYDGGPDAWWIVDSTMDGDWDHRRVLVLPTAEVT